MWTWTEPRTLLHHLDKWITSFTNSIPVKANDDQIQRERIKIERGEKTGAQITASTEQVKQ